MAQSLTRALAGALLCVALGAAGGFAVGHYHANRDTLPAVVPVTIDESGQVFQARLDTGAVVSSINAHELKVLDSDGPPSGRDTGKMISFVLINERGERHPLVAKIAQVRGIRSADCREVRYHVYLTVKFRGNSYRVLTNLNDRTNAGDMLLLGRNWLRNGFAVAAVGAPEI
ncbi:MAG: ATP-dependent zinc protease [Proteobacteria bacterium]|nr:ATP-dependent zinc protease [Pseudomonadota bacterium]